jgi:hypothetical protein
MFKRLLGAARGRRTAEKRISRLNLMEQLEARELFSTYYISGSGSDSNPGTSSSAPWRSIGKVNATTFRAGDSILFGGGQTFLGNLNFDSAEKGSSTSPITVGSYGTGKAAISAGSGTAITLTNTAGFKIQNLKVYGAGRTSNSGSGVYLANRLSSNSKLAYVRIDNVEAYNFGNTGIYLYGYQGNAGFSDVRITNSSAHDNAKAGIRVIGAGTNAHSNVYIGYSQTYNNTGISSVDYNTGSGIMLANTTGGTIERCKSHDNGVYGTQNCGVWTVSSVNIVIQYNESYNNKSRIKDGGGFDIDGGCVNCIMQYNYSHNNYGGGYGIFQYIDAPAFSNNVVRYNISENDGRAHSYAGIRIWSGQPGGLKNVEIYNNTIYTTTASSGTPNPLSIRSATSNVHIRNNIFVGGSGMAVVDIASGQSGFVLCNNDYYNLSGGLVMKYNGVTYTSLSAFRAATGWEKLNGASTGFNVNPQFVSGGNGGTAAAALPLEQAVSAYKLQSTSPLINKGLTLSSYGVNPGTRDFWGDALPQAGYYELGADEVKV